MFTYNKGDLDACFGVLDYKERTRATRSAVRSVANKVRRVAVANMKASMYLAKSGSKRKGRVARKARKGRIMRSARGSRSNLATLARGIYNIVYTKEVGFQVRCTGKKSMHTNRFGKKKPVLMWAEGGTARRERRVDAYRYGSRKVSTGAIKAGHFMEKTFQQVKGEVTDELRRAVFESFSKAAAKKNSAS